jgi:hypothetical protein
MRAILVTRCGATQTMEIAYPAPPTICVALSPTLPHTFQDVASAPINNHFAVRRFRRDNYVGQQMVSYNEEA